MRVQKDEKRLKRYGRPRNPERERERERERKQVKVGKRIERWLVWWT